MSTLIYCDNDDCQACEDGVYPVSQTASKAFVNKKWLMHYWDIHFCKNCVDTYWNEECENLVLIEGTFEIGKDFNED